MTRRRRLLAPFHAWTLANKLSGIMMLTTLVCVVLCYCAFAVIELQVTLRDSRSQLASLARVIAESTRTAAAYRNVTAATDALTVLRAKPEIVAARVVLASGVALAHYERSLARADPDAGLGLLDRALAGLRIAEAEPVLVDGEPVATLAITADLSAIWNGLASKLLLSAFAGALVILLVALPLSRRLQESISGPVVALADTARCITRGGNYAIRARRHGDDEVGTVIDGFNATLDRIAAQDAQIDAYDRQLEARVSARTRGLDRARERLVMALEASGRALWDCNGATGALFVSDSAPLYGGTEGTAVESTLARMHDLIHPEDRIGMRDCVRKARRGDLDRIDFEARVRREDATWQWIHVVGRVVERGPEGRALRLLGTLDNVTARRNAQTELQRARNAAQAGNRARSQLLAPVTQEIRTPTISDPGATGPLRDTPMWDQQRQLACTGERSAGHQVRNVNEVRADADSGISRVRFVMPSPGSAAAGVDEFAGLGVSAWLRKPVRGEELLRSVVSSGSRANEASTKTPATVASDGRGSTPVLRVLLVDDNPVNQLDAREVLASLHCRVTLARNGHECLDALEREAFDIVLMDCQMPHMDGCMATREWRMRETAYGRPRQVIVALTAHAVEGDREHCLESGMDDHLPKPLERGQLRTVIARHLGHFGIDPSAPRQHRWRTTNPACALACEAPTNTLSIPRDRRHHAEL